MQWMLWIVIGWLVYSTLVTVASVGKTRQPLTPGVATASVVIAGALITLIILGGVVNV